MGTPALKISAPMRMRMAMLRRSLDNLRAFSAVGHCTIHMRSEGYRETSSAPLRQILHVGGGGGKLLRRSGRGIDGPGENAQHTLGTGPG